jgi:4-amino-4-deoxy-L-arabinose transferase-like glycosyltransferase
VVLAAIPFWIGKQIEFGYFSGIDDSGSYVYSAAHILDGAEIGVEEITGTQPGTLLVNILGVWLWGFSETGPIVIQTLLQIAALVLVFFAIRKLYGTIAAGVAVVMASVFLSFPHIAKFGNVKELYMIAFMMMGASCFILYQLGGKWWWCVLAGAFVIWAPLFKPTGTSVIGAMGLFVIAGPFLKYRSWKQTGIDILLLLAGVVIAIGPMYVWILGWGVKMPVPYSFAWKTVMSVLPSSGSVGDANTGAGYVGGGRRLVSFSEQWPRVLRHYGIVLLPILLALGSILLRLTKILYCRLSKLPKESQSVGERLVLFLGVWWILDMAFVWISPRSYVQYYLPLNGSAAMLGGYLIWCYWEKAVSSASKPKWVVLGLFGLVFMIVTSWHVLFGISKSPYGGGPYPSKRGGFAQGLEFRKSGARQPWVQLGKYIQQNSEQSDRIYVWGWYPGIYVAAQRFSSASKALMMPRPAPGVFEERITTLLEEFEANPPKFIVDSRKRHIPPSWPPMELWPYLPRGFMGSTQGRFLPLDNNVIRQFEQAWSEVLLNEVKCDEAEVVRFKMFKVVRDYIMREYRVVRTFGNQVLFELKPDDSVR